MAAGAVLYVKDLARMRSFYERCFALALAEEGPRHCVLAGEGWELVLVTVPTALGDTITIADPPVRRADTPVKLVFEVSGLEVALSLVAEAGGRLDPAEEPWPFRATLRLDCLDPEGNVIQLSRPSRG